MFTAISRETGATQADVVIPVYRDLELTRRCIESVLAHSGSRLRNLIFVDDCGPDEKMRPLLRAFRDAHAQIRLLENESNQGFIESCNRGMSIRNGHVVILNSDTEVTPGWLDEMLDLMHGDAAIAAVCPLSNNATLCSVPNYVTGSQTSEVDVTRLRLNELPRTTEMPTGVGFCLLLRDEALKLLSGLDPKYGRGYHEENDWCQRAQSRGYKIVRANRAFVFHHGQVSFGTERDALDAYNLRRLVARFPHYVEQNAAFDRSPQARVAAIGARASAGKLKVCVDAATSMTRMHQRWIDLLSAQSSIELTVLLDDSAPLRGFDIVHRIAPIRETLEATCRLLEAEGHLFVSWNELPLFQTPAPRATWHEVERSRTLHEILVESAQRVLVDSEMVSQFVQMLRSSSIEKLRLICPPSQTATKVGRGGNRLLHLAYDAARDNEDFILDVFSVARNDPRGKKLELTLTCPNGRKKLPAGANRSTAPWNELLATHDVAMVIDGCDGSGERLLEAYAAGVPAVFAGPGLREVAEGCGVELGDLSLETAADQLLHLVGDFEKREALARRGRALTERIDPSRLAQRLCEMYREVALAPDMNSLGRRDRWIRRLRAMDRNSRIGD